MNGMDGFAWFGASCLVYTPWLQTYTEFVCFVKYNQMCGFSLVLEAMFVIDTPKKNPTTNTSK